MSALIFELSMPNRASWNGKWSGDEKLYAKVCPINKSKKSGAKAEKIIAGSPYVYNFGDGWTACINVHKAEGAQIRNIRKNSLGFCGYDWMVDSIKYKGEIRYD